VPTLKAQHALALSLAANIASVHEDLEEMKVVYTRLWRDKTGNQVRDPFVEKLGPSIEGSQAASGLQELRIV
jgi:nucleoporin p58/p45